MKKTTGAFFIMLMVLMLVIPASAQTVTVISTVPASFSMTVDTADISFPLPIMGQNDMTTPNKINVTANTAFTIKMKDSMTGSPPAGSEGKMKLFVVSSGTYNGAFLSNPLQVSLNGAYTPLSGSDQTIHTGVAGIYEQPLKLRQVVAPIDTPSCPGGVNCYYNEAILITGAAV